MPDIILDLAPCLQYKDGLGDIVTKLLIQNYVTLLGNKVCSLTSDVNAHSNTLTVLGQQYAALNKKVDAIEPYVLPILYPTGIASQTTPLRLDIFTALLEQVFVQERNAVGDPQDIFEALSVQLTGLDVALGTAGSTLGNATGWINDPENLANSYFNLDIILRDLRSAVRNLQLNFNTSCEGIAITMQGTFASKNLRLFFNGTIPSSLVNLDSGGSLFTIRDQSGNFAQIQIDVRANLNNVAGVTIDLTASSLNAADDVTVTAIYGFKNPETATVCQKYLELAITNSSSCPTLTITEGINSATVQFMHTVGTVTYYVELYNSTNELVQTQVRTVTATESVTIVFVNLVSSTLYRVRLRIGTLTSTKICPFTSFTTLASACPSPNNVSATFDYE